MVADQLFATWQAPFPDIRWSGEPPFPALAHLSLRLKTFRALLRRAFPEPAGLSALDIGAGPGHFARIATRHGFDVTAIDARPPWTLSSSAGEAAQDRREDFRRVQGDIREFDDLDRFDVIFAIGIIYHLPVADQLTLLRRCAGRPLVIDTEVYRPEFIPADRAWRFRAVRSRQGYDGALCIETGNVWSSNGDTESFWFSDESLPRALADTGHSGIVRLDPGYRSAFGLRRWCIATP